MIAVIDVTHEAARCHPPVLSVTWSRVVAPNHPHLSPTHWGWVSYWHRQRQRQSLHLKLVGEPGYSGRCKTTQYHAIPLHNNVRAFVHRTQFSTMHLFISHRWCRMFCMASNIFLCVFFPFNFSPILLTLVATLYLCEYFLYKKFVFLTKMNIASATGNCTKQHPHGFRNSEYLDWHEIGCCTKIICFHTQIPKQCNWRSKMDKIRQNLCHLDKKVFQRWNFVEKSEPAARSVGNQWAWRATLCSVSQTLATVLSIQYIVVQLL